MLLDSQRQTMDELLQQMQVLHVLGHIAHVLHGSRRACRMQEREQKGRGVGRLAKMRLREPQRSMGSATRQKFVGRVDRRQPERSASRGESSRSSGSPNQGAPPPLFLTPSWASVKL
jgi:hypothetical protein